jgi:hypothetical protein
MAASFFGGRPIIEKERNIMRISVLLLFACLLLAGGCTTTPEKERPKVYCPACGSEIDAIFHKHF